MTIPTFEEQLNIIQSKQDEMEELFLEQQQRIKNDHRKNTFIKRAISQQRKRKTPC